MSIIKQGCPLPSGTASQPPTRCCPWLNLTLEIEQEKATPPGTCHVHRGLSRKARREFHPGLCLSPAWENPCPMESRRAHTAYLEKEIRQLPLGTAQTSAWGSGDAFYAWIDLDISSLKEHEAFSLGPSLPHFKILIFKGLHWWDWALTAQKTNQSIHFCVSVCKEKMFVTGSIHQSGKNDQVIVSHKIQATATDFRRTSSPDHFIPHQHLVE